MPKRRPYTHSSSLKRGSGVPHSLTRTRVCSVNPVPNSQEWCLETGQDFVANHFLEAIDYTGAHMWSDNWGRTDVPCEAPLLCLALLQPAPRCLHADCLPPVSCQPEFEPEQHVACGKQPAASCYQDGQGYLAAERGLC